MRLRYKSNMATGTNVPYLPQGNFPATSNYIIPKGSMAITLPISTRSGYPLHPAFLQSLTGDAESRAKDWLIFHSGPHDYLDCFARRYVPLSIASIITKASPGAPLVASHYGEIGEIKVFVMRLF